MEKVGMKSEPFTFDEATLTPLEATACGTFRAGAGGVARVLATGDRKVEFVRFESGRVLAHVRSAMGYPAYYPLEAAAIERPVEAVLMDLDGTSVHSEAFWIWVIERTTARLVGNAKFALEVADLPFVSGHSVSEHLQYCIGKYAPGASLETAREIYFEITHREMKEVLEGRGRADAFRPAPGLKEFLLELKGRGIKIGLVTSGLHEKAWPEIVAAFRQLGMGDPKEFYDAIVTAGFPLRKGEVGTLGELEPKPHPWLYAETARVGLGVPFERRGRVIGLEDSGAGVVSIRLAGFACIGMEGGNIRESGTAGLCAGVCGGFGEVLKLIEA
jgi:beta-phosphoglucomutase-like phosphatase (HAD superfamily)